MPLLLTYYSILPFKGNVAQYFIYRYFFQEVIALCFMVDGTAVNIHTVGEDKKFRIEGEIVTRSLVEGALRDFHSRGFAFRYKQRFCVSVVYHQVGAFEQVIYQEFFFNANQ